MPLLLRLLVLELLITRRTEGFEALSSPAAADCFFAWPSSCENKQANKKRSCEERKESCKELGESE